MAAAMGQDAAVGKALATIIKPQSDGSYSGWEFTALAGAVDALQRRKAKVDSLLTGENQQLVPALLARARQLVTNADDKSAPLAVAASALLARGLDGRDAADIELLATTTSPQKPPELRTAGDCWPAPRRRSQSCLLVGRP
jgi:hypothetical protein